MPGRNSRRFVWAQCGAPRSCRVFIWVSAEHVLGSRSVRCSQSSSKEQNGGCTRLRHRWHQHSIKTLDLLQIFQVPVQGFMIARWCKFAECFYRKLLPEYTTCLGCSSAHQPKGISESSVTKTTYWTSDHIKPCSISPNFQTGKTFVGLKLGYFEAGLDPPLKRQPIAHASSEDWSSARALLLLGQ